MEHGRARDILEYTNDMYAVLLDTIRLVVSSNSGSLWHNTKPSKQRQMYHRLIGACRAWKGDDEWTIERDVAYIAGIRLPAARNAYIAKMAFWWREAAFDGLASREYATSKEDYLRNTFASAICGFYRFMLTKSLGCVREVDALYERLLGTAPGANSAVSDDSRITTFINTIAGRLAE